MLEKLKEIKQRETSGSDTFKNYDYQYHWALYTLLETSKKNDDIAILIEFHEDVILVEDISSENKLHFFQIKANDKHLTLNDITKKDGNKKSILDKLTLSKDYSGVIAYINSITLVSANGFNFCSDKIQFNNMKDTDKNKLTTNILLEIDKKSFFEKLFFEKSKLPKINFHLTVKGMLAEIIQQIHPDRKTDIHAIYLVLKDDLYDKGKTKNLSQGELLKDKGMTFTSVKEVIKQYTDINDDDLNYAKEFINNFNIGAIEKEKIKAELIKYSSHHINPTSLQAMIRLDILSSNILDELINICNDDILMQKINNHCTTITSKYNVNSIEFTIKASIFYELSKHIRETT